MGQQQILLIVLSLIIVGIAVAIAGNLFDSHAEEQNKDSIAYEIINLATLAQQYYNKPSQMGGGSNSFIGWNIPSELDSSTSGVYRIESANDKMIVLLGNPFKETLYSWHLRAEITNLNIITEILP